MPESIVMRTRQIHPLEATPIYSESQPLSPPLELSPPTLFPGRPSSGRVARPSAKPSPSAKPPPPFFRLGEPRKGFARDENSLRVFSPSPRSFPSVCPSFSFVLVRGSPPAPWFRSGFALPFRSSAGPEKVGGGLSSRGGLSGRDSE